MKAIVLTCDHYHPFAEHMILTYERLWPNHPFVFRIPYADYPGKLASKFGERIDPFEASDESGALPIKNTILRLLEDLPDDEWIYWSIDDKYLRKINVSAMQAFLLAFEKINNYGISGVMLARSRFLLRPEFIDRSDTITLPELPFTFIRRIDYAQVWLHQFFRVKVLRHLFRQFPDRPFSAKEMDTFLEQITLPNEHKLYVAEQNFVVFGESTHGGKITRNCQESFKHFNLTIPERFEVADKEMIIGAFAGDEANVISIDREGGRGSSQKIRVQCPHCDTNVNISSAGKWSCPMCKQEFNVSQNAIQQNEASVISIDRDGVAGSSQKILVQCPHCKANLNISSAGKWSCPTCKQEFSVSQNAIQQKDGSHSIWASQHGQDQWVAETVFNGKRNGFFLDMGAADGIKINNTVALEKQFGWNGICVEPFYGNYKLLTSNRNCICVNELVDSNSHTVDFWRGAKHDGHYAGIVDEGLDTTKPEFSNQLTQAYKNEQVEKRNTITLLELLDKYNAPPVIDYFSLDVEGAEERILETFDFSKYTFLAMTIERPTPKLNALLRENGYIFVENRKCDTFYVHSSLPNIERVPKQPFQEHPQLKSPGKA